MTSRRLSKILAPRPAPALRPAKQIGVLPLFRSWYTYIRVGKAAAILANNLESAGLLAVIRSALKYDPKDRLSAAELLALPWFNQEYIE